MSQLDRRTPNAPLSHETASAIAREVLGSYMGSLQPNDTVIRAVKAGYAAALAPNGSLPAPAPATVQENDLRNLLAAAYQIVGVLADQAGLFEHPSVLRALDALSNQKEDPAQPLLPFPHIPFSEGK